AVAGVTAAAGAVATFSLTLDDISGNGIKIEGDNAAARTLLNTAGFNVQDNDGTTQGATITATAATNAGDLVINGIEIGAVAAGGTPTAAERTTNVIAAINELSDQTGVVASAGTDGAGAATTTSIALRSVTGDTIQIQAGNDLTDTQLAANFGLQEQNDSNGAGSVSSIDISTQAGAQKALNIVDTALEQINSQRADLGAVNNRLDFTVSNLANVSENTSAARSRIVDADFAKETAELSRAQVLQQASQAILAQANARPQQVLSLLN
ncbi:MAG: flagellin, partial [Cellvibrionaceae bacterium]